MDAVNPKYVLRNALAQRVIEAAEQGDMAPFERLFAALQHPMMSNPNTRISLLRNRHGIAVASSLAAVEEPQMNWHIAQTDRDAGVVTLVNPALDWDSFPTLAEALLQEWELVALEQECGADCHCWLLEFEGAAFGSNTNTTAAAGWWRSSRPMPRCCSGWPVSIKGEDGTAALATA